jgi:hypothetical protein
MVLAQQLLLESKVRACIVEGSTEAHFELNTDNEIQEQKKCAFGHVRKQCIHRPCCISG